MGANDPYSLSQTWLLEKNGRLGVLVEPQAALCEKLRSSRKNSQVFQVACSSPEREGEGLLHIGLVDAHSALETQTATDTKVTTLNKVLSEAGAQSIDFLSLDVEGHEIEVMRGFDFEKYRPLLILIEDNVQSLAKHCFLVHKLDNQVRRVENPA